MTNKIYNLCIINLFPFANLSLFADYSTGYDNLSLISLISSIKDNNKLCYFKLLLKFILNLNFHMTCIFRVHNL